MCVREWSAGICGVLLISLSVTRAVLMRLECPMAPMFEVDRASSIV